MSISRNLFTVLGTEHDRGRILTTRTGKVMHRVERVHSGQGTVETSCTKFFPVITHEDITLVDKKGKWGVLLGDRQVPTCRGCKLAHDKSFKEVPVPSVQEEVLTPFEVTALANVDSVPCSTDGHQTLQKIAHKVLPKPAVGDIAYVYSRGLYRRGVVVKVGRMKASVLYTTVGAVETAQRTYESYLTLNPLLSAKNGGAEAGRNYDYYVKQVTAADTAVGGRGALSADKAERIKAYAKFIGTFTRAEYVTHHAMKAFDKANADKARNDTGGMEQYIHFTTKADDFDLLYIV